ncbi:MAG: FAD-binding oxidoreductase [Geminicoccaceae bacterium]|nr:FAD-binding oxidoreductase [Geminicoccaceae bacterium]
MQFEFIVIGAGMAGASVAAELARSGKVAIIERESRPGYHTTGRSAAVYLKSYGNAVIKAMTSASEDFYHNPPEGFSEVPLLHPRGMIMIARQDQLYRIDEELELVRPFVGVPAPSHRRKSSRLYLSSRRIMSPAVSSTPRPRTWMSMPSCRVICGGSASWAVCSSPTAKCLP